MRKSHYIEPGIKNTASVKREADERGALNNSANSIEDYNEEQCFTSRSKQNIREIWNKLRHKGLAIEDLLLDDKEDSDLKSSKFEAPGSSFGRLKDYNSNEDSFGGVNETGKVHYRAQYILGSVETINDVMNDLKEKTKVISVSLDDNNLFAIVANKNICQDIINLVRDHNISIQLKDVLPIHTERKYKVTASIGGITCAACASSITNAVSDLDFVSKVAVNVVSKVGVFILDTNDEEKLGLLKETIEDCGFIYEAVGSPTLTNHISVKTPTRHVTVKIEGMFCSNCPVRTIKSLRDIANAELIIDETEELTLKHPYIKFTYIPNVERGITIRSIFSKIKEELTTEGHMDINVVIEKEITLEDHLKEMSNKETWSIAKRLIVTTFIAIPTFVFGIVGMALLPSGNEFRKWVEEPIWVGDVSRVVWILFSISTPVYFFIADIFHRKALKEIYSLWKHSNNWKRRLFRFGSMNLLMSLGTSVAYFASIALLGIATGRPRDMTGSSMHKGLSTTYFDSVVFLSFFLLIGRLLESLAKTKTASAISSLSSFKQETALLVQKIGNQFQEADTVKVEYLELGDYIKISPGQSPPLDSIILEGESEFDESALTGESIPILRVRGDQIFAGTVNVGSNSVVAKVSSFDGESLLDQIVSTVRDGQLNRAPIERLADILTGYFVPIIIFLAILTWVIWLSLGLAGRLPEHYLDTDIGGWPVWSLEFAISVFVIACPCGIGLAAPTALFVGSGMAARYGILCRGGGSAFQEGSNISVVCFDKTGTLTMGNEMKVTNYSLHGDEKLAKIGIEVTRDLEAGSRHPLAIGVKKFIDNTFGKKVGTIKIPDPTEITGGGLKGEVVLDNDFSRPDTRLWKEVDPEMAIVGNERLLRDHKCHLTSEQLKLLAEWKSKGKSLMVTAIKSRSFFGNNNFYPVMMCAARDEIRPEAEDVIKELKRNGIECWMISGDNEITARAVAQDLDIENVIAEVLPDEKADKVKWIQRNNFTENGHHKVVAMVGDGINDAPALAAADVGIALASGSELAMTSCDFVLLSPVNTLISLLALLKLSKKVFSRIKFNFTWALVYNMLALPIAAGVIYPYQNTRLSPVWASAAMALSSVSVLLSSLALRLYNPTRSLPSSFKTKDKDSNNYPHPHQPIRDDIIF
ncbi:unnamed protein product [Kluyveromyces dobzhanskii CBS 2104]|uniref:WGS project CCBQ000000000 data, contig 00099 n=1 Tax=Kluyveromyces dobzhanskii CBS 2104 TaxID=1427455 RepID=A0A0A8L444_9SACH|nr:unnamed protein product [Kluyveromyces dobzhanskii CBS 2104]